jgi:hypothetical protein
MSASPFPKPAYRQAPALAFRSIALVLILSQFRLIARDLADTPVFAASLAAAFAVSLLLAHRRIGALRASLIIGLVPWTARLFVALPRTLGSGIFPDTETLIHLDSLLLHIDRNNFVALLPYYWAGFWTYFAARSRKPSGPTSSPPMPCSSSCSA